MAHLLGGEPAQRADGGLVRVGLRLSVIVPAIVCLIHAPNKSVDPSEIEHLALAEALSLQNYAEAKR